MIGTNRVCGRCLALKDTVVDYTDESGVTLPPLHPRCRCAISYREVGDYQPKTPRIVITNYKDVAKPRSQAEFVMIAEQLKPDIERYTALKSKWNGKILLKDNSDSSGSKYWDCSIRLNPDAPLHALIHELIHSCSVSHFGARIFAANRWEEELTVHYLSQELARLGELAVVKSDYDSGVALIRELKAALGSELTDLEFASELIKQPLGERWEWLWERIADKMKAGASLEFGQELMRKLEAIRRWYCE